MPTDTRSAREDYPAADLLTGWASIYERLWAELDQLRANQGPWELKRYDPDYDERRGGFDTYGNYRSREKAQAIADANNAEIVARINAEEQAKYDKQMKRWREFQRDSMPSPPILLASLDDIPEPKHRNARWGGKYFYEFMEVQAMEFEDD